MNSTYRMLTLAASLLLSTACWAETVVYELVPIRNAGNAGDPLTTERWGGVNYDYSMGKYEVTIGQYVAFLNAVARTDTFGLYNPQMAAEDLAGATVRGIARSGSSGSYSYSPVGPNGLAYGQSIANRPVTYVSWLSAARFANWMSNNQPTGAQDSTTTENGAYDLGTTAWGTPRNSINPNTGSVPLFHIPTENEWYKAALYSPVLNSGSGAYYSYATQSYAVPGNVVGSGFNQANVGLSGGIKSLTQSNDFNVNQNYLTDVGAYTNSASFYGTYDQTGNVGEWTETTTIRDDLKRIRGSTYDIINMQDYQERYIGDFSGAWSSRVNTGFRLASPVAVPEPSTYAMALAGLAYGGYALRRRRRSLTGERRPSTSRA
jgi:sulfatase modifying factor 1